MRVLILTTLYPNPYATTRAPYNREQFRALADGHEVSIVSPIAWTEEASVRWRKGRVLPPDRYLVADNVAIYHPRYLYPPKILRGSYGRLFRRSARAAFDRVLRDFKPDVVLGSWTYPDGWAAVQLAREAGLPAAVKVHGCDILFGGKGITNAPGHYRGTVEALRAADAVIAVSKDLACNVEKLGVEPGRIHVVFNGVDTTVFRPGSRAEARSKLKIEDTSPLLLFIGNLVPVKGLETLLAACHKLAAADMPFRCYLVGDGPLRSALEQQISQHHLTDRVRLVGSRPHGELADWFRAADLFVLPSKSEGIPNVLLEAIACGTRFVATRVGGIPEITSEPDSRLVPPGDPTALADAIARTLGEDPSSVSPLVPPTSWRDSAEALARVLRSIISPRAARDERVTAR